jgi:HAD superfamily hydrolase (TIGR01490 family)
MTPRAAREDETPVGARDGEPGDADESGLGAAFDEADKPTTAQDSPPESTPREAAFFDLDKTLLPGAALFPLAREMYRQGVFTNRDIARIAADQVMYRLSGKEDSERIRRARETTLAAVKGRPKSEVDEMGRLVVERELLPRFYPQAVELMSRHKRVGREVYISSSSPEDFLSILAEAFGVDGVIGTRAEVADGVYTGRLEGELCNRDEKARRVKELAEERGIDLLRSFAYSDSINDLPLLELVGNPVAMNPDIPLVRIARRNGWQVIDLRVSRRRTLLGSAVGATAAAAAAAGYGVGFAVGRTRARRRRLVDRVPLPPAIRSS